MRACAVLILLVTASATAEPPASGREGPWQIPSNDEIRKVLAERLSVPRAGMVVGVIEPAGARVVARGESHAPDGRPLDGETMFMIGSVTKTFTTLLLADEVRGGAFSLDEPATRCLPPGMTLRGLGRPITLRDLATHVSGLPSMPSNFDLKANPDPVSAYSPRDLARFLDSFEPRRAPGEKWEYSNLGVSLLGLLLAQCEHTSYEALLRQRVLDPLGLHSTAIRLNRSQARRLTPGLDRYGEAASVWEMNTLQASGSLRSSANDLLQYLAALLGYRQTSLRAAIELQLAERSPVRSTQALGWGMAFIDGHEVFVHDGGKAGYRALLAFDPARRRGIVLLVNARTDERLGPIALWLISGRPLPAALPPLTPRPRVAVSGHILASYEGRYHLADGREIVVVHKRGGLLAGTESDGPEPFVAENDRWFYDPGDVRELQFARDGDTVIVYEQGRGKSGGIAGHRVSSASRSP